MDPVERNSEEENETTAAEINQVTGSDEEQNILDEYIARGSIRMENQDEYFDEDHEERENVWRYTAANIEANRRFCALFTDLVTKYSRPVKKENSRRPLTNKEMLVIIIKELELLGLIHTERVDGDPEKLIVYTCNSEKKSEIYEKYTAMTREEKLRKQEIIKKYEDTITQSQNNLESEMWSTDFKITKIDQSTITETQKSEAETTEVSTHKEHMESSPPPLRDLSPKIPRDLPAKTSSKYARGTSRKSTPAKSTSTKSPSKSTSKPWK
ncbi:uncharacterized protein LOC109856419 [Pseudomyrmex gracilis]|uniref:uncharacterized protein LOC109856419 n=1 Tax=Pseudomyrmex gracilis TaxID=219809 RepID=UPI000995A451|nr:uncharacterized protein LOC109856419 [Pseudomyrmex gracilis]